MELRKGYWGELPKGLVVYGFYHGALDDFRTVRGGFFEPDDFLACNYTVPGIALGALHIDFSTIGTPTYDPQMTTGPVGEELEEKLHDATGQHALLFTGTYQDAEPFQLSLLLASNYFMQRTKRRDTFNDLVALNDSKNDLYNLYSQLLPIIFSLNEEDAHHDYTLEMDRLKQVTKGYVESELIDYVANELTLRDRGTRGEAAFYHAFALAAVHQGLYEDIALVQKGLRSFKR